MSVSAGSTPQPSDRRIAAGIFFLVFALYVLTYVGAFKSNDERALFGGVDSFVKRGEFTVNQIYWDYTNVGMLTSQGDMVPNYEPAQMVAAIPLYLWGRALGAAAQGVMVFNAIVTAAAAALLFLCFLELEYGRRTATLGSLVFAFATLAWPYSRTFFREPLTMLAYLLTVYGLLRYRGFRYGAAPVQPTARRYRWLVLTGFALGLALITKQTSVALVPSLLVLAVAYEWRRPITAHEGSRGRVALRMAAAMLAPLALMLLLGRLYQVITLGGVEVFARNIVEYTTNPQLSQTVPARMMRAFLGITVSPYKGLFWYSPVLILGLVGAFPFTRRHRWEGLSFLLLIALHLLGYSRYNYWSAGVAWGMRYLLPVVPFLVLLAAPVWAWLLRERPAGSAPAPAGSPEKRPGEAKGSSRLLRWLGVAAIVLLIALSVAIQVLGIAVDLRTYEVRFLVEQAEVWGGIGQAIEALYLNPAYSPVLGHLRLLLAGTEPLDVAWVQHREMGTWAVAPQGLMLSLLFVGLAAAAFVAIWRRPERAGRIAAGMAVASIVFCTGLVAIYRHGDRRYDQYGADRLLRPMTETLAEVPCGWSDCSDALLVPDPVLTDYFLNYLSAPLVWYGVDPKPVDEGLMATVLERYPRVWLARDRNAQTDDQEDRRAVERYLAEHAYKLDEQTYDNWARLLQFSAAGTLAEEIHPQQALGDMTLVRARLGLERRQEGVGTASDPPNDGVVQARPGDTLQVGLTWRADQTPQATYTVFVQLLDGASQVVAQADRWPGDGLYPTAALSAGQVITDQLALPLDVAPGSYRLIAGLYRSDVEGLPRLSGPAGDTVLLGEVSVLESKNR